MAAVRQQQVDHDAPTLGRKTAVITSSTARRLDALTSLRFVAAAAIVVWHISPSLCASHCFRDFLQLPQGVSFFFVLSGFILSHVYPSLEAPGAVRNFLVARVARIWPVHLLAFGVMAAAALAGIGSGSSWLVTLSNVFLVQAWLPLPEYFLSYNSASWTISVEWAFYLTFVFWIAGFASNWPRKLLLAALLAAGTLLVARLLGIGVGTVNTLEARGWGYALPTVRVIEFVLGMVAYRAFAWLDERIPSAYRGATGVEVIALAACVFSMWQARFVFYSPQVVVWLSEPVAHWVAGSGSALVFAATIVVFAFQRGALSRVLTRKPMVLLGEISYSIYLLHGVLWVLGASMFVSFAAQAGSAAGWFLYWTVLIAVSYCCWRFVEVPARSVLNRLGRGRVAANPATKRPLSHI
jgi:peptidoglycan/LPS O-acetylase OafA/YrhL